MREKLEEILKDLLIYSRVRQWMKDCVPKEKEDESLDLTCTASADWQYHYENVGFNQCRMETLKNIERV